LSVLLGCHARKALSDLLQDRRWAYSAEVAIDLAGNDDDPAGNKEGRNAWRDCADERDDELHDWTPKFADKRRQKEDDEEKDREDDGRVVGTGCGLHCEILN